MQDGWCGAVCYSSVIIKVTTAGVPALLLTDVRTIQLAMIAMIAIAHHSYSHA